MRGCHWGSGMGQHSFDFAEDLLVLKQVLVDRTRRTRGHAGAAPLAERLLDDRLLFGLVKGNSKVGTKRNAGFAARTIAFEDVSCVRFELDVALINQGKGLRRGRARLGN